MKRKENCFYYKIFVSYRVDMNIGLLRRAALLFFSFFFFLFVFLVEPEFAVM